MPANLESSAVARELDKVSFHPSNCLNGNIALGNKLKRENIEVVSVV